MSPDDVVGRFRDALEKARAEWRAADPARCAARSGSRLTPDGVLVPFFGVPHLISHPDGVVTVPATRADSEAAPISAPPIAQVHAATVIVLLHYLLMADGAPPADSWVTFRELPDGLFYAPSFAQRTEEPLVSAFAERSPAGATSGLDAFSETARTLGGEQLELADRSFRFQAFPRVPMAVLLWAGDDEGPGQARVLFDAHAGHYLAAEDAAGLGESLARRLVRRGQAG